MSLVEVAKEMKKNATEIEFRSGVPFRREKFVLTQRQLKQTQKVTKIGNCEVRLSFSLDTLDDKQAWHLSMGRADSEILSEELVKEIVGTFFPGDTFFPNGKIVELPSFLHGKKVRQFLRFQED